MASLASTLGLTTGSPSHLPVYLAFNFLYAHALLSARTLKQLYKIDHNVSPREDLSKYGDAAVRSGKLTSSQLAMLQRNDSAHHNRMENYAPFAAASLLALYANVPSHIINTSCLIYTLSSLGYAAAYIFITDWKWTYLRSTMFWVGNDVCLFLFWRAWLGLNGGK